MPHSTDTAEAIRTRASDIAETAQSHIADVAKSQTDATRDAAASKANEFADAARDAGQNFDPDSMQAEALRKVATTIEGISQHLRDKPIGELADDAAMFARRNPLLVLSGAAVAGFAIARFLKSSTPQVNISSDDPWSGHLKSGHVDDCGVGDVS